MKTLIALGSGLDSTNLLYELLHDTDDAVHGIFCELSPVQYDDPAAQRDYWKASATAEKIAIGRIHEWLCTNVRAFTYQVVVVPYTLDARAPTVIREAAMIVCAHRWTAAPGFDRFIFGRAAEQMCTPRNAPYYRKIWADSAPPGVVMEWPLVERNQGRPHALAKLPKELQALTISCFEPTVVDGLPVRCNDCPKCRVTDLAREMHDAGFPVDDALVWIMRKVGAGRYHLGADVDRRYQSGRATDELHYIRSPEID